MSKVRDLNGLFIEITNKCHMYCKHCSSEASASNKEQIPPERLFSLVDEGIPLGLKNISFSGGEPLLYPELFSVLEYSKNLGLEVCIYSCGIIEHNGELGSIDNKTIEKLKKLNVNKIIFSMHGACDRTHDFITQVKGSFYLVLESIKRALKAGLDTELHFVPMLPNYMEIPQVVKLADSLGVKQVSLLRLVPQGRCKTEAKNLLLNKQQSVGIIRTAEFLRGEFSKVKIRLGAPFNCVNFGYLTPCSASKNKLLISASGKVFPCEAFKWAKEGRSNIYDSPLKRLWVEDKLLNQLRSIKLEDIDICSECPMLLDCYGGCPGQRMLLNGSIYKGPESLCQVKL